MTIQPEMCNFTSKKFNAFFSSSKSFTGINYSPTYIQGCLKEAHKIHIFCMIFLKIGETRELK